jgi:hypothetical protein
MLLLELPLVVALPERRLWAGFVIPGDDGFEALYLA